MIILLLLCFRQKFISNLKRPTNVILTLPDIILNFGPLLSFSLLIPNISYRMYRHIYDLSLHNTSQCSLERFFNCCHQTQTAHRFHTATMLLLWILQRNYVYETCTFSKTNPREYKFRYPY